jgi:hypothetical protein
MISSGPVASMSESNRLFGVGDQALLAEFAGARAVSRILGEDDAQAERVSTSA